MYILWLKHFLFEQLSMSVSLGHGWEILQKKKTILTWPTHMEVSIS